MKILVISHMYPNPANEISGRFVHEQVKALKDLGMEVTVISPKPRSFKVLVYLKKSWGIQATVPEETLLDGVKVYYPKRVALPGNLLFRRAGEDYRRVIEQQLMKMKGEASFDLIHAHVAYPDGYAAAKIAKRLEKPFIVTIHGQDFQQTLHMKPVIREKLKDALRASDRIVTVSSKLERAGKAFDPSLEDKWRTIENGFEGVSEKGKRTGKEAAKEEMVLLSVGNLIRTKGNHLTIQAFSRISKDHPGLKLRIVGSGRESEKLVQLAKELDIEDKVSFPGKLPHREVLQEMEAADLFVLPSYLEGFGVVYLEAMANGMPVIACQGEGIDGVVRHGQEGFLVKPRDAEDLYLHLNKLVENPGLRREMGDKGKSRAKTFTWKRNAELHDKLYREVMNLDEA